MTARDARGGEARRRKVFVPYVNGGVYDLWGGEPNNIRVFMSRLHAEKFGFDDIREIELWMEDET